MYRHDRPEKGRYRQFHQIGVECFGMAGPDIDAELLVLTARLWKAFRLTEHARLEINSIGTSESRKVYREALVRYLEQYKDQLDDDSKRRLGTNPLRILDSKDPATREILNGAPWLNDYLDDEPRAHSEQLKALLDAAGVATPSIRHWFGAWITTVKPCSSGSLTALAPRAPSVPVAVTMGWFSNLVASPPMR